ncbi:hypothetical protein EBAPG3_012380 [Nitrosospira lacus]|uniref:Uncharacterized protein n=1 Tax=Nitrosospira lacus TaxID=1288494 RepID=A0A1W6SRS8_9PROT|nr:hypothetical protein EBAPG3_012380 [Nitrosospira lacus]
MQIHDDPFRAAMHNSQVSQEYRWGWNAHTAQSAALIGSYFRLRAELANDLAPLLMEWVSDATINKA